jgi:DNA-binding NarL/FixJ family response regulator
VLLADDYEGMLAAITRLLTPSCEVVGHVADGARLLEAATRLRPDVVVLDVRMPAIDGLEACRRLKAAVPRVEVIVLTADDDANVRHKAIAAGASAFVLKIRAADDLLPAVAKALARGGSPGE